MSGHPALVALLIGVLVYAMLRVILRAPFKRLSFLDREATEITLAVISIAPPYPLYVAIALAITGHC